MIQVYKKNELFIIENTVTDIIYPNLTREEALVLLEKFGRNETEDRCDFAIKEDNISFEYASLDDKDKTIAEQRKQITDLEAKLAKYEKFMKDNEWDSLGEMQETLNKCEKEYFDIQKQLAEKEKERELDNSFWKQECDSLQKALAEKEKEEFLWLQKADELFERGKDYEEIWQFLIDRIKSVNGKRYADGYTHNQDKISFCIEQLEKVLVLIHNAVNIDSPAYDLVGLYDAVSNQINELKSINKTNPATRR